MPPGGDAGGEAVRAGAGGRCAGSSAPSRVRCEPKTALKNKVY